MSFWVYFYDSIWGFWVGQRAWKMIKITKYTTFGLKLVLCAKIIKGRMNTKQSILYVQMILKRQKVEYLVILSNFVPLWPTQKPHILAKKYTQVPIFS